MQQYRLLAKLCSQEEKDITEELLKSLMKITVDYFTDKKMIHLACHAISNIALDANRATYLCEQGVLYQMLQVLQTHQFDAKIVWKASSAVWNLSRPTNISNYLPAKLSDIVFKCLFIHQLDRNCVYTTIGALSNLAIAYDGFSMHESHFTLVKRAVMRYENDIHICTHVASFLANIAVQESLGAMAIANGFVQFLANSVRKYVEFDELVKHSIAGMNNLADLPGFVSRFVTARGMEALTYVTEFHPDEEMQGFVEGIRRLAAIHSSDTSSLHIAARCNMIMEAKELLETTDINVKNEDGHTPLQIAIYHGNSASAEFLAASNAYLAPDWLQNECDLDMRIVLKRGVMTKKLVQRQFKKLVTTCCPLGPNAAMTVCFFLPGSDILTMEG